MARTMEGRGIGWTLPAALLLVLACGGKEQPAPAAGSAAGGAPPASDLTAWEMEHGIGPVKEPLVLGPVEHELAEDGEKLFETKCSACHKVDQRYVGPPLGGIAEKVKPEFVMNMMLNPQEMYTRHPVVKKLLAEYMTQMPNQGLTVEEARAVLEYLRTTTAPPATP
jgi:mono/diheme cytochrome c family protein